MEMQNESVKNPEQHSTESSMKLLDMHTIRSINLELSKYNYDRSEMYVSEQPQMYRRNIRSGQFENQSVNKLNPQVYDGTTSWPDFLIQFKMFSELNSWTDHEKFLYLGCSLRGIASETLSDLESCESRHFDVLVKCLGQRFGSENQEELFKAQLKNRTQFPNETFPELAHAIKRLVRYSYPKVPDKIFKQMILEHFVDAIKDTTVRELVYLKEPCSLDEAVRVAFRIQMGVEVKRAKLRKGLIRSVQVHDPGVLCKEILDTNQNMNVTAHNLSDCKSNISRVERSHSSFQCHNCRKWGHIRKECFFPRHHRHGRNHKKN